MSAQSPIIISQTLLIEGLNLTASIGILEHEKLAKQRVIIDADIQVVPTVGVNNSDTIDSVLSYVQFVDDVTAIINEGHIGLVETLAQRIINQVAGYSQALSIVLSIKKPDIMDDVENVGVMVEATFDR